MSPPATRSPGLASHQVDCFGTSWYRPACYILLLPACPLSQAQPLPFDSSNRVLTRYPHVITGPKPEAQPWTVPNLPLLSSSDLAIATPLFKCQLALAGLSLVSPQTNRAFYPGFCPAALSASHLHLPAFVVVTQLFSLLWQVPQGTDLLSRSQPQAKSFYKYRQEPFRIGATSPITFKTSYWLPHQAYSQNGISIQHLP